MAALTTASGTRIEILTLLDPAWAFLDRYGPSGHQLGKGDRIWGAFEGTGPMVGIGILGACVDHGAGRGLASHPNGDAPGWAASCSGSSSPPQRARACRT